MSNRKKLVQFNKYEFDLAQKKYKKHLAIAEKLHKEIESLLSRKVEPGSYEDPLQFYYSELEKHPGNTLNLSGKVIAELQTKPVFNLHALNKEYQETKMKAPTLDEFSLYAETDAELERLKALETLQDAFRNFIAVDKGNLKEISLAQILPYRVQKTAEGNLIPAEVWLKTGKNPLSR